MSTIGVRARPGRMLRSLLPLALLGAALLHGCDLEVEARHVFLIPEGLVGTLEVRYDRPDEPPLPVVDGRVVHRFGSDGKIATSTPRVLGWTAVEHDDEHAAGTRTRLESSTDRAGGKAYIGSSATSAEGAKDPRMSIEVLEGDR